MEFEWVLLGGDGDYCEVVFVVEMWVDVSGGGVFVMKGVGKLCEYFCSVVGVVDECCLGGGVDCGEV